MNRAERRKQIKQLTPQNIENIVLEAVRRNENRLKAEYEEEKGYFIETIMIMVAYTLNLEGYGKKRLPKVMYRIMNNIDSYRTKHLSREDYQWIKKEMEKFGIYGDKDKFTFKIEDVKKEK